MDEREDSLQDRLVIGRKRDGRRQYDEAAKEELIQACLKPGASIARTAMTYGVNPNLVRTWIAAHQRKHRAPAAVADVQEGGADTIELSPSRDAFVPVVAEPTSPAGRPPCVGMAITLHVRLPNGVEFDLGQANLDELATIVQMLGRLPCSGSTTA